MEVPAENGVRCFAPTGWVRFHIQTDDATYVLDCRGENVHRVPKKGVA